MLIWRTSAGYNPDAPSGQGWSTISSSINTAQVLGTTLSLNHQIDPYSFQVLSTSVTSSFGLQGTHGFGSAREAATAELNVVASDTTRDDAPSLPSEEPESLESALRWQVNGSLSYSKGATGDARSTLNVSGSIDLTRNWHLRYNANYNVEERELFGQFYEIQRDLHCWQMSLSRQQLGNEWEFYFRISIVAHPEIYAERGDRGLGSQSTFGSPFQF